MFVVIGKEGERRILIHHICLEDVSIPRDHFVEATGHVDNVG
jgi:hypothetical protein